MFKIQFETDNAAFQDANMAEEIAVILQEVSRKIFDGHKDGKIKDVNGNTIGEFTLTD